MRRSCRAGAVGDRSDQPAGVNAEHRAAGRWTVGVYVPGRNVNTMPGAFRGEGKTDPKDPRVIAETARIRSDLNNVTMPS